MENEIGFALYMLGVLILLGLSVWVYGWYKSNIESERATEIIKYLKDVFWTNTAMGWMWRELFGKEKAKQAQPPISSYNTSSLNMGNKIGKPLVIQNWDRLTGMVIPIITNPNFNGHNWIVTHAGESRDGYSCMLENGGGFGTSNKAVSLNVYSDMYDSHRVLVKCGGRISTMDIEVFKDPNNMLYKIANEFQEKFR